MPWSTAIRILGDDAHDYSGYSVSSAVDVGEEATVGSEVGRLSVLTAMAAQRSAKEGRIVTIEEIAADEKEHEQWHDAVSPSWAPAAGAVSIESQTPGAHGDDAW